MQSTTRPAILGVLVAIAITTAMDATGYTMLSALPLFPLVALFWLSQRFSKAEMGLTWGALLPTASLCSIRSRCSPASR